MKPIRIVYISHAPGKGSGAEQSLSETLQALNRNYIEPFIICPPGAAIVNIAKRVEIPVIECRMARISLNRFVARLSFLITAPLWIKKIRNLHPDIIHCNSLTAGEYGLVVSTFLGVPCAVHVRTSGMGKITLQLFRWARKRLTFLYVSRYVRNMVAPMLGEPIDEGRVIYNFRVHFKLDQVKKILLKESLGVNKNDLIVCTIGRVTEQKGQREFIEAGLGYTGPGHVYWFVVGDNWGVTDPKYYNDLYKLVEIEGNPKVRMLGYRLDARSIIDIADIVVLASYEDSFPGVILEAMDSSKPVIAMQYDSGAAEMVINGETGYLLTERSASKIAEAVRKLADNSKLRRQMGCAANILFQHKFSVQSHIMALGKIYTEMLNHKSNF